MNSDNNTSKQSASGGLRGKEKRNSECEAALGRMIDTGESCVLELAKKCAERLFHDADLEFITRNKLTLATQQEFDFKCATCYGLTLQECPFGGHEPYLRVDPDTGLCLQYVNSANCGKIL